MKLIFTTPGPVANTICDDSLSPPIRGMLQDLSGSAKIQTEPVYNGATEVDYPRGNVGGTFSLVTQCSYASYNAVDLAITAACALLGSQGSLVFTPITGATDTLTFANAVLKEIKAQRLNGVELYLAYTFKTTSLTSP